MIIKFLVCIQAVAIAVNALALLEPVSFDNDQIFENEDTSKRSGYLNAKRINDQLWKYLQRFNQNGHHSYRFGLIGKRNNHLFDEIDEDDYRSYRPKREFAEEYYKHLKGFGFS